MRCNDPDVVWDGELAEDQLAHLTDVEYDEYEGDIDDHQFMVAAQNMGRKLLLRPEVGTELYGSARTAGWNPDRHRLEHWLMHRMALAFRKGPQT